MKSTDYLLPRVDPHLPPYVPEENETVLAEEPPFVAECRLQVAEMSRQAGYRFGKSLTTSSEKYGFIWRIDFDGPEFRDRYTKPSERGVNRFVAYQRPNSPDGIDGTMIIFGQDMPPL